MLVPDAVVLTCGEKTLMDCLSAVQAQTLSPREVILVENVTPAARAAQGALDEVLRRKSQAFVQVDADMILHPRCFEVLAASLEARPDCFQVIGHLEDGIEGPILGVRIYRPDVILAVGGFRDVIGLDRDLQERAESLGWNTLTLPEILGRHNPVYSPEAAFIRYSNKTNRLKGLYGLSEKTFRLWHNQLKVLIMHYAKRQELPAIAALAGHFCGLVTEVDTSHQDSDIAALKESAVFQHYMDFFSHYADPLLHVPPTPSGRTEA